jgi:AcrR family transcriptional regulator
MLPSGRASRVVILATGSQGAPHANDRRARARSQTRAEIVQTAWQISREQGLAGLTLRAVAARVGMRAPSLYSYFDSKNAIYDAMFAQGCREFLDGIDRLRFPGDPLADMTVGVRYFVDFCIADPVRYQLLFQRTVPGFAPSPESYALAVQGLDSLRAKLEDLGITDPEAIDLLTAISTGLTSQQISNDPGGDRWARLVDRAVRMFYAQVAGADGGPDSRSGHRAGGSHPQSEGERP